MGKGLRTVMVVVIAVLALATVVLGALVVTTKGSTSTDRKHLRTVRANLVSVQSQLGADTVKLTQAKAGTYLAAAVPGMIQYDQSLHDLIMLLASNTPDQSTELAVGRELGTGLSGARAAIQSASVPPSQQARAAALAND